MKRFSERNHLLVGGIGIALAAVLIVGALQYKKLPFISRGTSYGAYFADAAGLRSDAIVQVSGYSAGRVEAVRLDGSRVFVTFKINDDDIRLGERTEAAIRNDTLLGTKILEIMPRGKGRLSSAIPIERTRSPYQLPDALGDLSTAIQGLDTNQLSDSLATLAQTFKDTPPDVRVAVDGIARFAKTLNTRDEQLRNLLTNANKATSVLAQRSDQVVALVRDANSLLAELQAEGQSLDTLLGNVSAMSRQLSGLVAENREQLRPALEKLNGVLAIVDKHKADVQRAIKLLNTYALSLGESVSSGPYFNGYVANLLPGQFIQPFVDAAFSDLGVDPNTLLPSQLTEPPVGQPATPALPSPFPRTGQGGEPRMTLPDAITGKPGDPRYPYREPLPAPPPGGPPPGPPAAALPGFESVPEPTPSPVFSPAPGEAPPGGTQPQSAGGER
jgi:phospholipid/cholesterol/gamma-HCH transport system substrate-binding protein